MRIFRKSLSKIIFVIFILLFVIRIAPGQSYWIQITNKTEHFIHVIVNNKSFLYVAPNDYIRGNFGVREFQVKIFYAPGQNVSGKVERELSAQGEAQTSCERNVFCDTVPANNAHWEVTPEDIPVESD